MKTILTSVCLGALASAFAAQGADVTANTQNRARARTRNTAVQSSSSVSTGATVRASHRNNNVMGTQVRARNYSRSNANVLTTSNNNRRLNTVRQRNITRTDNVRARNNVALHRGQQVAVNRNRNANVNRNVNLTRNANVNRTRNVTVTNNWRGNRFNGRSYSAFRNYHRAYHDRSWWRSHYTNIVFVGGGWYYWNSGYWYPAWGYAPNAYYSYDGPIYGYNNLGPDQVVVDVQERLQREGYYSGPVDGELGPNTRQAIANFQADHGLAVTAAVDEPTLETLGVA